MKIKHYLVVVISAIFLFACENKKVEEINIGYIGPLSVRAVDLGKPPSLALQLAVNEYNDSRKEEEPKLNLYIEDDQWEKSKAIPLYDKLRKEHQIKVLFISNTDGTVALQEKVLEDGVIMINQLNSDDLLSTLNKNTFKIAKRTEEANGIIGRRIAELKLKKILIFHFPNDFMTRAAKSVESILAEEKIQYKIIEVDKDQKDFTEILQKSIDEQYDGYVFFGYRNFGFAMKQARNLGIEAQFFGSTTLMDPVFYDNSQGAIVGTEYTYFTPNDGNYVLANKFIENHKNHFGAEPVSIWPAMQAYDAANILISILRKVNSDEMDEAFDDWLRKELHNVSYYQGVCGNISIGSDAASKGIYFSLYEYIEKGKMKIVKR